MSIVYPENHTGYGTVFGGDTLMDRIQDPTTGVINRDMITTDMGGVLTTPLVVATTDAVETANEVGAA